MTERFTLSRFESPVGTILTVVDQDGALVALDFSDHEERRARLLRRYHGRVDEAEALLPPAIRDALERYFSGAFDALADLPRRAAGTPFQRRVWAALGDIPAGRTESYGVLAARIGAPAAVRAVGLANGANPVAIAVPCHRVIGADGTLTGYGGGLARKRWLLRHEGARWREDARERSSQAEFALV